MQIHYGKYVSNMQKRINDFDGILRIIGNQNSLKQKVKSDLTIH